MPFQPGHTLSPGRPKGSRNKSTDLHAKCKAAGLDVFERMLALALEANGKDYEWTRLKELAQYLYAKPKEVDITEDQVRAYLDAVINDTQRSA